MLGDCRDLDQFEDAGVGAVVVAIRDLAQRLDDHHLGVTFLRCLDQVGTAGRVLDVLDSLPRDLPEGLSISVGREYVRSGRSMREPITRAHSLRARSSSSSRVAG